MGQPEKIDKVYEKMIRMEDRFKKLKIDQQSLFEQYIGYIENAATSIIAEIKKKIGRM